MTDFTLSLAGVPLRAQTLWPETREYCRDYLSEEEPRFTVCVTQAHIDAEREIAQREAALEGRGPRRCSDRYLEPLALYRLIAARLLDYGAVVFHGSAVAAEGRVYLFTAPSGTGKTTHSRLWLSEVPGSYILNGDKPLLRVEAGRVLVCGTPWRGKERYGVNEILPLAAICVLERAEENRIEPISLHDALPTLIRQTHRPREQEGLLRTLELISAVGRTVKLYRLGCNREPEAARVSWNGMREAGT